MTYIVIELQKFDNGTVATLVTQYTAFPQAEAAFHQVMAAAAVSALPKHGCIIMTDSGEIVRNEIYSK